MSLLTSYIQPHFYHLRLCGVGFVKSDAFKHPAMLLFRETQLQHRRGDPRSGVVQLCWVALVHTARDFFLSCHKQHNGQSAQKSQTKLGNAAHWALLFFVNTSIMGAGRAYSWYSDYVMGWTSEELWLDSRQEQDIYFPSSVQTASGTTRITMRYSNTILARQLTKLVTLTYRVTIWVVQEDSHIG